MPWHVARTSQCPTSKPYGVIKDATGKIVPGGCHKTKAEADKHKAALYASEDAEGAEGASLAQGGKNMAAPERRFTMVPVEVRESGGTRRIGGYAALFNRYSQNLGGFVEQVAPSAFNKSRGDGWPDVLARYNHDDNRLLGTIGGNTLHLSVDGTGLVYEVEPPKSRADVVELVERGDVRKSSFAFRVFPDGDEWSLTDQGFPLRTLVSVQLVDVAPVNLPAYTDTTAGMRQLIDPEVALRSLAAKVEAELAEVLAAAKAGVLHRYLEPTGSNRPTPKPKPRLLGGAALAQVEALRDPWA